MAKWIRTEGQIIIYKTLCSKTKDPGVEFGCSCSTSCTRRVTLVTNPVISHK